VKNEKRVAPKLGSWAPRAQNEKKRSPKPKLAVVRQHTVDVPLSLSCLSLLCGVW
jgi:hypothetical protein